jgi:hypothetical protein
MWIFTYEKLQPHPKLPRVKLLFQMQGNPVHREHHGCEVKANHVPIS